MVALHPNPLAPEGIFRGSHTRSPVVPVHLGQTASSAGLSSCHDGHARHGLIGRGSCPEDMGPCSFRAHRNEPLRSREPFDKVARDGRLGRIVFPGMLWLPDRRARAIGRVRREHLKPSPLIL
jgi:hypothetical protein